jgi:hypothetical protein
MILFFSDFVIIRSPILVQKGVSATLYHGSEDLEHVRKNWKKSLFGVILIEEAEINRE